MTYNTGNPVPSTDPRDLYDNAENLDKLVNGENPFYADRLGKLRESWAGMENSFTNAQEGRENAFTLSQADKESRFQAFLVSSGYVSKGDYAPGVVLAERNEYVAVDAVTTGTSPGLYRPNASATLPLTLTGTWATDAANLVLIGGDALRQELAGEQGAGMVGWARQPLAAAISTAGQMLSAQLMNIWEFAGAITSKPDPLDPETWDWAPAFQAAFDAGGGLFVPQARYPVRGIVTATKPLRMLGLGQSLSVIVPDIGADGTKVFAFETNDVTVEGIHVDGAGLETASTVNKYAFFGGDGVTKFSRHTYHNCAITDWNFKGDSTKENLIVAHGFYVDNVDDVVVEHNVVNGMSGCAVFLRDNDKVTVTRNKLHNSAWYPIHVAGGMFAGEISYNVISCDLATGIYWGGAIDLMNQHSPLETRSNGVHIFGNDISGVISYGAAIRILSCENVRCYENKIHDWSIGSWSTSGGASAIRVDTRGTAVGAENGPCRNIHIQRNRAEAPSGGASNQGVYVSNQFQSARNPTSGVWVQDNDLISLDAARAFTAGVIFHGFEGGIEDVYVDGNRVVTLTGGASPVSGAIGFVATNAQGKIDRVFIGKNDVSDIGTPSGSTQIGYAIGANTDNVLLTAPSIVRNFYVGLRSFAGSGPNLYRLSDFLAINCTLKTIFATEEIDLFGNPLVPSIASSSALVIPPFEGPRKTITVTGTTTINSCAAQNHKGQEVTLVFGGTILVNDTNQLKLAGALNATNTSTLTITSDGTNWFEVSRSIN